MAESVKKPPKICAVCGQVLDQWLGKWIHTGADHEAVPVDYDEDMLVAHCDFCHDVVPLADRWVVPAKDFMTALGTVSDGNWAACATCAELITANKWDDLIERPLGRQHTLLPREVLREFLTEYYARLRKHQTGPPRPFRPGDEGATYQEG